MDVDSRYVVGSANDPGDLGWQLAAEPRRGPLAFDMPSPWFVAGSGRTWHARRDCRKLAHAARVSEITLRPVDLDTDRLCSGCAQLPAETARVGGIYLFLRDTTGHLAQVRDLTAAGRATRPNEPAALVARIEALRSLLERDEMDDVWLAWARELIDDATDLTRSLEGSNAYTAAADACRAKLARLRGGGQHPVVRRKDFPEAFESADQSTLLTDAFAHLSTHLVAGAEPAEAVAAAIADLDLDSRSPKRLEQIPDVPVPAAAAGLPARQAAFTAWREVVRVRLREQLTAWAQQTQVTAEDSRMVVAVFLGQAIAGTRDLRGSAVGTGSSTTHRVVAVVPQVIADVGRGPSGVVVTAQLPKHAHVSQAYVDLIDQMLGPDTLQAPEVAARLRSLVTAAADVLADTHTV